MLIPELDESSSQNRRFTKDEVLGTYLPFFPEFTNRPLYQILQQYCNPAINETYTALRVNPDGRIMPTLVFRQIPFTTEAFQVPYVAKRVASSDLSLEDSDIGLPPLMTTVTRFLSLPRWAIPPVMITALDVGRSDATRTNFVHVYGASSLLQNNVPVQYQMVNNPPRIDHLDVQRSGMRSYSATVECWVDDQVGKAPAVWMDLVADRMIGSQYTLNGTLHCFGIQSPIAEGDNTEIAGVAFHIESVAHNFAMHPDGKKTWSTSLTLTNGMRAKPPEGMDMSDTAGQFPMYAGFAVKDLTEFDPGLTAEHDATTGGVSDETGLVDDREKVELTVSDSFIDYGQLPNEDL
jgi:hypothetical protein